MRFIRRKKEKKEGSRFKLHYIVLQQRHLSCKKKERKKRKMAVILILFSEQLLSNFLGKVQ